MHRESRKLADRFAEMRQRAGFANQRALAAAAGVKQSTIADIEAGRTARPRGDTLMRLAQALDVPIEHLLTDHQSLDGGAEGPPLVMRDKQKLGHRFLVAVRLRADEGPPPMLVGRDDQNLLRARVVETPRNPRAILVGDVLTIDLGGPTGLRQLVAYVRAVDVAPFEAFHIAWREGVGRGMFMLPPGNRIGRSEGDPFVSPVIEESGGEFRPVGPIVDLYRTYLAMTQ